MMHIERLNYRSYKNSARYIMAQIDADKKKEKAKERLNGENQNEKLYSEKNSEKDMKLRALEQKAKSLHRKSMKKLMGDYYSKFNYDTGDIAWWCYMGIMSQLIKVPKGQKPKDIWLL